MTTYFLDSSALVKHYRAEQGSSQVEVIFDNRENDLAISELSLVELVSALQRLKNSREITDEALSEAMGKFDEEARTRLAIVNLNRDLIVQAKSFVQKHGLRTLDALLLASVLSIKSDSPVFVSADANLLKAAQANGLAILNPLASA